MAFEIKGEGDSWCASHVQGRCGGPWQLEIQGKPVISNVYCAIDGQRDEKLRCRKGHLFHKAGQTIFECSGDFKSGQSYAQTCTYAGNALRITWDINWSKDTPVKESVEVGSATLVGEWSKFYVVNAEPVAGLPYPGLWKSLTPGEILFFEQLPASLVFERNDGVRVEYSLGFDLWRWQYGLGVEGASTLTVQVGLDKVTLVRRIAQTAAEEGVLPEPREYRFMALLAWSWPEMEAAPAVTDAEALQVKSIEQGLEMKEWKGGAVSLDYGALPCIDAARRTGFEGTLPCLETSQAISAMKRCIRQLANASETGVLEIRNLAPGFCRDGRHVSKHGERLHWDLYDILVFMAWAKNCLGAGWKISCPQDIWHELPSLAGLHLANGYLPESIE